MKKTIISVCILAIILLVAYLVLHNWPGTAVVSSPVSSSQVTVNTEEQKFCDNLGARTRGNALSNHFVINIAENTVLENGFDLRGCIKNFQDSFGNWEITDGYVASYKIFTAQDELVSRGVFALDQQYLDLQNISQLESHIPFAKTVQLGDTRNNTNGYISIRNTNPSGDPKTSESISVQIRFK